MSHPQHRFRVKVGKPSSTFSKQTNKMSSKQNLTPTSSATGKSKKNHTATSRTTDKSSLVLPHDLKLHTRDLMTAYVNHSKETSLWITTINTNQAGNRQPGRSKSNHLQAFSFRTEHEARESAYVNAPPKLISFDSSPQCFVCESKFNSVFRRPSHCRNCGICICSSCTVSWSKVMVPDTYNTKNTNVVKACKTCDYLAKSFRHSLLSGNYDAALKLYMTGNVNLRCPFFNVRKGKEIMLPIHCAVAGGNLKLLIWLVDVHHCPLKMTNTNNRNKQGTAELIKTSTGRTVVDIAIENKKIEILQYLVNEKRVSVSAEGNNSNTQALSALEAVLKAMPKSPRNADQKKRRPTSHHDTEMWTTRMKRKAEDSRSKTLYKISNPYDDSDCSDDDGISYDSDDADGTMDVEDRREEEESVATTVKDPCILCYERSIDCVLTPCGHQICCLQCSQNMTQCPICSSDCKSIRIFRP